MAGKVAAARGLGEGGGMAGVSSHDGWRVRMGNRWQARLAGRARLTARLVAETEPHFIGSAIRGAQILAGDIRLAGHAIHAPGRMLWEVVPDGPAFAGEAHGFGWLDDLAALGDDAAEQRARDWLAAWITRYGRGTGPGWTPALTGRRVLHWVGHAGLLRGESDSRFVLTLARQVRFLARRWSFAPPGLPRLQAMTGLIVAALALEGQQALVTAATDGMSRYCADEFGGDGGIGSRNPEALLEQFSLLTVAGQALGQAGLAVGREHLAAIGRIAPALRALSHADGKLARFQGGGPGEAGRLDQALASSGVRPGGKGRPGLVMGYARLSVGRTTVIVDAAVPPRGEAGAHASTLGLELTSGRRALIVSCGDGGAFGADWLRAGRETASHSALTVDGRSSSRFAPMRPVNGARVELLTDGPEAVTVQAASGPAGQSLILGHDGYAASHGLTHMRRLNLSADGRALVGEDMLTARSAADRVQFGRQRGRGRAQTTRFAVRFHLHPDVVAVLAAQPEVSVVLTLLSGEVWQFRQHGGATLTLEPSVYLDPLRPKPRATKQIVLSGAVIDYAAQVGWTLAKAQATPQGLRDLGPVE